MAARKSGTEIAVSDSNSPALSDIPSRLPMTQGALARGITPAQWRVLVETTFPSASSPEAVEMAFDYCMARGLDIFKKPVHIVPMWSSTKRAMVETIWPGINEIQITASRTGQWAGMDSPKWGPIQRRVFVGERNRQRAEVEVEFPEWCEVTVYRLVGGQPRPFSEPVFWMEAYSTSGGRGSEMPTDMWIKRPRGQLQKVAKAASLRAAFPEEGELTAEEMEGKEVEAGGVVIDHAPVKAPPQAGGRDGPELDGISASQVEAFEKIVARKLEAIDSLEDLDGYWHATVKAKVLQIKPDHLDAANRIISLFSNTKNAIQKKLDDGLDPAEDGLVEPEPDAVESTKTPKGSVSVMDVSDTAPTEPPAEAGFVLTWADGHTRAFATVEEWADGLERFLKPDGNYNQLHNFRPNVAKAEMLAKNAGNPELTERLERSVATARKIFTEKAKAKAEA